MTADRAHAGPEPSRGEPGPASDPEARSRRALWIRIAAASVTLGLFLAAAVGVNLVGPPPTATGFVVDVHGERFVIRVTDPETVRLAQENLDGGNRRFPVGTLAYGDGGFNAPWSWHLRPDSVRMAENAIELCDGRPGDVEQNLTYWVETVRGFCPWAGRIVQVLGP